jgi:hypothetical protein
MKSYLNTSYVLSKCNQIDLTVNISHNLTYYYYRYEEYRKFNSQSKCEEKEDKNKDLRRKAIVFT